MNIRKHKKKLAAVLVLGVAAAISIPLLMPQKPAEDTVREREYTAVRDTITVGVESSGLVDTGPNAHTFEAGTVVENLLIKVGSEVKKGDPLATISTEQLKELIGAAQDELSDAKAALLQASSSKDVLIAQNDKDKQDGLDGVQQEYANQIELLTSEKTRIESSIAQQEAMLAQLQQQIADGSAQVGDLEEKVERLKRKINQNILEIGRLNEELLKVDDGSDERNTLNIAKAGAYKYVQSPDFEILLFAYSVDGGPVEIVDLAQGELLPEWLFDALGNPAYIKHAYNAAFEWYCLSKFCGHLLPVDQWRDTMLHGLYCGFTAGLDATGKALGLPAEKQKLSVGKALIRYFCVPCAATQSNGGRTRNLPKHDPDKWELFKTYCKGDVTTEMEIDRRLSNFPVPADIEKQWQTDLLINARGVAVDMQMVRGALEIDAASRDKLTAEAVSITGLENPNSVSQLSKWLESNTNQPVGDLRKDTVAAMLDSKSVTGPAERMLEIRQELGKTSTKKYDAIEAAVCSDGRVRGLLQFYGANRTGRWAGRLVQVQNLPRTYIDMKTLPWARSAVKERSADKLRCMYGSVPDTLSQLIRTSFIASNGNTLIDADFSAIEARVISWLAGEQWRLEVFRTHGKIYEASASQMFGVPIDRIKKGNPEYELRQKGKVAELALGYQGSTGALIAMGALRMGIPEDDLPDIVSRWRDANRRIVDLWYAVENAAVSVIQTGRPAGVRNLIFAREMDIEHGLDFLTITLPSRRKLYYANPQLGVNSWDKPSILYSGVNQTTKQWTQLETYGGKLVENCIQAIARDCLALAIEHLEAAG